MGTTFDPKIDHQYHGSRWSSRKDTLDLYFKHCTEYSEEFRAAVADRTQTVKYGDHGPKQVMDIVTPIDVKEDSPILVFIHGGYWVETSRDWYLFTVRQAVERGWIGVVVGYDQAPEANMTTIVQEIRESFIFLSKKFPESREMVVTGHSAGGHLAAMLLATDWADYCPELDRKIPIRRCVPICGVLDLRPIIHISYNEQLRLTEKEIQDFSPILNIAKAAATSKADGTKVVCVVAEEDPPKLIEVSGAYTEALNKEHVGATFVQIQGVDHFDVIEKLKEPNFELHKHIFG